MVFALAEDKVKETLNAFTVRDNLSIHPRALPHLNLPMHYRQNREVISMLEPLTPVKSYIYRNGLREFLFQRDD